MDKLEDPKHRTWYESGDEDSAQVAGLPSGRSSGSDDERLKGLGKVDESTAELNENAGTLPRIPSTPKKSTVFINLFDDDEGTEDIDANLEEIIQKINTPHHQEEEGKKKEEGEEEGIKEAAYTEMGQMEPSSSAASSIIRNAQPIAQSVDIGTWHNDTIVARSLQGSGSAFAFLDSMSDAEKGMVDFLFFNPYEEQMEIPADVNDLAAAERNKRLEESLLGNLVIALLLKYFFYLESALTYLH